MAQFMIDITLPAQPNAEFFALVPRQRAHIQKLLEQGTITGCSLSIDRTKFWVTLNALDEEEAAQIVRAFPLFRYFDLTIHPLMFHDSPLPSLLKVSLN
jgi:muconolactone delta-isomerase